MNFCSFWYSDVVDERQPLQGKTIEVLVSWESVKYMQYLATFNEMIKTYYKNS